VAVAGIGCAATLAFAGCGGGAGDGKAGTPGSGVQGAERTVRSYLLALVEGDGTTACSLLSDPYQREIVERNARIARQLGATDCEEFIRKLTGKARAEGAGVTFEGERLTGGGDVEGLDLKTRINTNLEERTEDTAVVSGAKGLQTYDLEASDGRWKIRTIR
jgi:hypothetical protein